MVSCPGFYERETGARKILGGDMLRLGIKGISNTAESCLMLVWQCHKPSPIHHYFYGWHSNHQKWVVYGIAIPTLWEFNIAVENVPFIVDLPVKSGDFP